MGNNNPTKKLWGKLLCVIFACLLFQSSVSAYRISGTINGNAGCYYPRVYLSVIDDISGFYHADEKNRIAKADIDTAGCFLLEGNDLPAEPMFYRLYFTPQEQSTSLVRGGSARNFIILLLHQQSDIRITIPDVCAPFFSYHITGSADNDALTNVQQIIDSYYRLFPENEGETRKLFYTNAYQSRLFAFADSTHSPFAGLRAIMETDIAANYITYQNIYHPFAVKIKDALPKSIYSRQLEELLQVESYKNKTGEPGSSLLVKILTVMLVLSFGLNIYLYIVIKKQQGKTGADKENQQDNAENLIQQLTMREREILLMIDQGLSNKEIADKLNVEVSTIKTHVSRIYQKINISSRKEVRQFARFLA